MGSDILGDASGSDDILGTTLTWEDTKTFVIPDTVAVAVGDVNFLPPQYLSISSDQAVQIIGVRAAINSGTSATVSLNQNGSGVTGLTAVVVTPTPTTTSITPVSVADGDVLALVVSAISGTPKNMSVSVIFQHMVG